jgi:hypothetical protein
MEKIKAIFTEQVRAYIYRVLMAAGVVALVYGVLTESEIATWLGFAGAVLNILPVANTKTTKE